MIPVTKTFIPPILEYQQQVNRAFEAGWLTNRGQLVIELEQMIEDYLDFKTASIILMTNGTIPIQIALKILGKQSEIITTPFSYVATTSSIVWENCTPVFVDIHPEYLTIDEREIEKAITDKTSCILATHVFGNPCNVDKIEKIAQRNNLKIIYDGAHSFGVKYKNKSIFEFGDVSTCSFHATKLFHCGEGGATFCKNEDLSKKIFYHHNFGHNGPDDFFGLGINGKMSELQAALGLTVLPYINSIISERKASVKAYRENLNWDKISTMKIRDHTDWNYSYFPIIFENEEVLINVVNTLNVQDVFPRRYFYPALNSLNYVEHVDMINAEYITKRIICLPLYVGLSKIDIIKISSLINETV